MLALQRLVFEDPTIEAPPSPDGIEAALSSIEEEIADIVARRRLEEKIERRINDRMQQRHEDYVNEIRMQILREDAGPDTPEALRKLEELEKLEGRRLAKSAMEIIRPSSMSEIVGQDSAVRALMAKIATPYPQHVILYGPPGVGKTTARASPWRRLRSPSSRRSLRRPSSSRWMAPPCAGTPGRSPTPS